MTENAFIQCEGLVKIYKIADLEVVALQGLDLSVARGEMLGIVGASGSGKTTLMNILGGLDRPSAGRVSVDGLNLLDMPEGALNRYRGTRVGFIWQQGARNLIPYLTALENVRLPMTIAGQKWGVERKYAEKLLESVGLTERRHHRLLELSGGEQQRVAIAVALANNPIMLLADEPTGEVDSKTAIGIFQVLQDLNRQYGVTILIVSHDSGIARYVDRVVAIRDGKTSSETVRQRTVSRGTFRSSTIISPAVAETTDSRSDLELSIESQDQVYHEVILLDSAGRLQVPRAYLDQLQIKGRATLELVEGGILIRAAQVVTPDPKTYGLVEESSEIKDSSGWRSWLNRKLNGIKRKRVV